MTQIRTLSPLREVRPFNVVRDFELALAEYTGARDAVAVSSCTMALLLAVAYQIRNVPSMLSAWRGVKKTLGAWHDASVPVVEIPKRTYVGVPMSIVHAGAWPQFRDEEWSGAYQLSPLQVWDAARRMRRGMFHETARGAEGAMVCVSFHWTKTLGIQQGGAILLDDTEPLEWLRRARFDGRREGVAPKDDSFDMIGWHCYMSPEIAAAGLVRLAALPDDNPDLPNDPYPDLSQAEVFK